MKMSSKVIIYFGSISAALFGMWLLKKAFYDKGYDNESQERKYLVDAVLTIRGMPVTEENRKKLSGMSIQELMKELGIRKDENGNYVDLN